MEETCELCKNKKKLLKSHIIPKFFYKYIKKNSPTGYLREVNSPNIREQDGLKIKLLCTECEQKFSTYEKYYNEKIFSKKFEEIVLENEDIYKLRYFLLSLFWRVGMQQMKYGEIKLKEEDSFSKEEVIEVNNNLNNWRILLDDENHEEIKKINLYILPISKMEIFDNIKNKLDEKDRVNDLFENRAISYDLKTTDMKKDSYIFCTVLINVPNFLFLTTIWGDDKVEYLYKFKAKKGVYTNISNTDSISIHKELGDLIQQGYKSFLTSDENISDEQRKRITEAIE